MVIPPSVRVFTDGACSGNPGPGGWGWAVDLGAGSEGPSCSGSERASTNQRMEVWAVLDALQTFLHDPATDGRAAAKMTDRQEVGQQVKIVSDSTYVVNCFRDSWYRGWIARGWKNSQKQPVANQDLWKPLIALYLDHQSQVSFEWIKGHSGNRMNDLVDTLAVAAAMSQHPRRLTDPSGWFTLAEPTRAVAPGHSDEQVAEQAAEQVHEQTSLFYAPRDAAT